MYIQIGGDMAVRRHTIIGIFDLDNASYSKHTRKFLQDAEENGSVISVSDELPKAFILTQDHISKICRIIYRCHNNGAQPIGKL